MSADVRSTVRAFDAAGVAGRAPRTLVAALSLLAGVVALLALAPLAQALPAGRGYEKVSPADKDGQDILNGLDMAGIDGNSAAYISFGAFGDSEGGGLVTSFRSVRTATDWATESVGTAQIPTPGLATSLFQDYSLDTSSAIVGYLNGDPGFDGATPGTSNLYRREPDSSMDAADQGPAARDPRWVRRLPQLVRELGRPRDQHLHLQQHPRPAGDHRPRPESTRSTTRTRATATTCGWSRCCRTATRRRRAA